jgi:PAS domain S-box-containing protein
LAPIAISGSVIVALGTVALGGYITGIETNYGWANLTRMALHTSIGFAVVGSGIFAWTVAQAMYEDHRTTWIPLTLGIGSVAASLCLWQSLTAEPDYSSATAGTTLVIGAILSVMIWFTARFAQTASRRAELFERANVSLEDEITQKINDLERSNANLARLNTNLEVEAAERKLVEAALGKSEEKLRRIVEASPAGLIMVDEQGSIVLANEATEKLFGYSHDELLGQPIEILVPNRFRSQHPSYRRGYVADPSRRPMGGGRDLFGVHKSGTEMPIEIGLTPVKTDDELFVLSTIIDLRERKRVELDLRTQSEQLARANADLEQFAYVASHDLKSPLRAIDNLSKWIMEDVVHILPERSKKHLHQMRSRVVRMEHLLDDLLAYSRAGRTDDEVQYIECRQLVQEIIETLDVPEGFQIAIGDSMPSLHGCTSALRQVLMNLICNAIKHHDRNDGRVTVEATECESGIVFVIEDDGPGIAPEFHERAFKPFQTLQSRDAIEGTGLGLAIVKRLVENEGGSIQLTSQVGKGARFRITWPTKRSAETSQQDCESATQQISVSIGGNYEATRSVN